MKQDVKFVLLVGLCVLGFLIVFPVYVWAFKGFYECHSYGEQKRLVVSWSPTNGCTAVILNTPVKLY